MRRSAVLLPVIAIFLLGLAAAGPLAGSAAQEATPGAATEHPVVGAWVVDSTAGNAADAPAVAVVSADGTLIDSEGVAGAWRATGPRTAATTLVLVLGEEQGGGTVVIRGEIEVDAAGETWTQPYSATIVAPDGTVVGSARDTAVGRRVPVEPVEAEGTPLAAVPTWAPAAEGGTPTP